MPGTITIIPTEHYAQKPWKNGKGVTRDVLMTPEGSDHTNFDIRVAFSPITEKAAFSCYEGVERVLTLIKGSELSLAFDHHTIDLQPLQSHRFDCELPLTGDPGCEDAEVINVMVRKNRFNIMSCTVASDISREMPENAVALVIPLSKDWIVWNGNDRYDPKQEETVLLRGPAKLFAGSQTGRCLFAEIHEQTER